MDNFTEIFAKPFNLTIPENTYVPDQVTGTWPSGEALVFVIRLFN
jgi:hypothetical protein